MPGVDASALLAAWDRGVRQGPTQRSLTLLATVAAETGVDVATVDVGSRDVLLARLLEHLVGPQLWAGADCSGCAQQLDVPVDVGAVAGLPVHEAGTVLRTTVDGEEVVFRLPTSADLVALTGMHPEAARRLLLGRCLQPGSAGPSPEVVAAVEAVMEEVAPGGAIDLSLTCPDCGVETVVALDVPGLLWAEVEVCALSLLDDVHVLAREYGWTESEVLALTPQRRAAYLRLVDR